MFGADEPPPYSEATGREVPVSAPTESQLPEKEVVQKGKVEEIVEPMPEVTLKGYVWGRGRRWGAVWRAGISG